MDQAEKTTQCFQKWIAMETSSKREIEPSLTQRVKNSRRMSSNKTCKKKSVTCAKDQGQSSSLTLMT